MVRQWLAALVVLAAPVMPVGSWVRISRQEAWRPATPQAMLLWLAAQVRTAELVVAEDMAESAGLAVPVMAERQRTAVPAALVAPVGMSMAVDWLDKTPVPLPILTQ